MGSLELPGRGSFRTALPSNRVLTTTLPPANSIHDLGRVGHIEDIAVAKDQQGKKLGLRMIQALDYLAEKAGCYKVPCSLLDCGRLGPPRIKNDATSRGGVVMTQHAGGRKQLLTGDTSCHRAYWTAPRPMKASTSNAASRELDLRWHITTTNRRTASSRSPGGS